MKKILVPTDFSPNSTKAIDYAVQVAKINKSEIFIVHACNLIDTNPQIRPELQNEYNKAIADEAFEKLDILKNSIKETEHIEITTQLYDGNVNDTILDATKDFDADIIIMGTLGITGLKDKIFGSKTASIIGKSQIPVIAIPLEYEWQEPKKILLAINNFKEASDLVHPVFTLASIFNAQVHLAIFSDEEDIVNDEHFKKAEEIILIKETLKSKYPYRDIEAHHLSGYKFQDTLNEYIQNNQIDLLAMITHKRNFITNIFNRSITKQMSYHTTIPLLSIPFK